MKKAKLKVLSLLFLTSLVFFVSGCGFQGQEKSVYLTPSKIKKIVVLPFASYQETEKLPILFSEGGIITGKITPKVLRDMDYLLEEELSQIKSKINFFFLPEASYEVLLSTALKSEKTPEEVVKFIAQKTLADGILCGKVFRFRERQGSAFSVKSPASVAFILVLYDGKTGKIIWKEVFDETQKPLSENLFNLSLYGKIAWLTAEELAQRGLHRIIKSHF